MIARAPRNGTRRPWDDVAFACLCAAIDAIRMAGTRREPDVSTRIIGMLEDIIDVLYEGLDERHDEPPLNEDGSFRRCRD